MTSSSDPAPTVSELSARFAADLAEEFGGDLPPALLREIAALPKVSLHDHLDGGLRPATIVELAAEVGHELPAADPGALARWFVEAANSGSLVRYLETFDHTVAVMQTASALRRVAREAVLDLAADGVVHGELRYAPEQHLGRGLTLDQVVESVQDGLDEGVAEAAVQGAEIRVGQLVTAMRHADRGLEIARLALAHRDRGVLGFDIAGAELGFPPSRHAEAFALLAEHHLAATVHAGEADGVASIAEAVVVGRAARIGHGVRLIEDVDLTGGSPVLGRLAHWIRDRGVVLELCPSSNLQTGAATGIAAHPITRLRDLGFAVTVNPDNRLVSGTRLSREMALLVRDAGWTLEDLRAAIVTAARGAFVHHEERQGIVRRVSSRGESAA